MSGIVRVTNPIEDPLFVTSVRSGVVDTSNTTTTALAAGGVYTGEAVNVLNYSIIAVAVKSNVASATDGLSMQQSSDGINWRFTDEYTIPANAGKVYSVQPSLKWFRVVYTNGSTIQAWFDLSTIFKIENTKPSSHRIKDTIVGDDDAELVKAAITGVNGSGLWHNVEVTADGNLAIVNRSDGLAIAQGLVTGTSFNGDTQDVEIQGLDSNFDLVVQTKTLTGQTPVELDTHLIRVFRMKNMNSTDFAGHVFCYVSLNTTVTAGVPQDGAKVRGVVHSVNNQTEMAVFTIPNGKTGYMRAWYASTAGAKKDSSHTIKVLARPFGGVFQLKHTANIDVNGTSYIKHDYVEPEVFAAKTDIEIRMNTDKDEAGVSAGFDIVLVDD